MFEDKKRDIKNLIDELIFHESDKNSSTEADHVAFVLRYCDEYGIEVPNSVWSRQPI